MSINFSDIKNKLKQLSLVRIGVLIALILICGIVFTHFVFSIWDAYRNNVLRPHYHYRNYFSPAQPVTVDTIQLWMTFDYINFVFHLPPNYLRDALKITDPHYPRLQIGRYARHGNKNPQELVNAVQNAVRNYKNTQQ